MKAKAKARRPPAGPPAATLTPDTPALVALHGLLHTQHRALDRLAVRLVTRTDADTVHDFRTALRRCLGLYKIFRQHLDVSDRLMEAQLKSLARALAPLRDWDVWMELMADPDFRAIVYRNPAGLAFLRDQRRERQRLARVSVERVRRVLTGEFRRRLRRTWRPSVPQRRARTPIVRLGTRQLAAMAGKLHKHPADIVRADLDRMHEVRKALRRIRHMVELLEPALPPAARKLGRAARKGERPLGQVRDIDLALARLETRADALARRLILVLRHRRSRLLARGQRAWKRFRRRAWARRLQKN